VSARDQLAQAALVPPHNLDAEESVLGAMLANPGAIPVVHEILAPQDFFRANYGTIYGAMLAMHERGEGVDAITLADELAQRGVLEDVGGKAYIHTLNGICPDTTNAKHYASIVRRESLRRAQRVAYERLGETLNGNASQAQKTALQDLVAATAAAENGRAVQPTGPCSYSGPEIAAMTFPDPDPVLLYAERGTTFDVVGKMKKGKTTFVLLACKAALRGEPFLDMPTKRVKVLYLTEQSRRSFRDKLRSLDLLRESDLRVLFRSDFIGWSWNTICELIGEQVHRFDITLLVVDTVSDWAQVEDENSAAEALRVMDPLRTIAEDGVAVVTVRHAGKGEHGGQDVVDVGRGSSAFAGAVDTLCVLEGAPGSGHPNRRQLRFVSRKDDVPPTMVIELKDGAYVALGPAPNVEYAAAREFVLTHLASSEDAALGEKDILAACHGQFSRSTLKRVLNGSNGTGGLIREGIVTGRVGAGTASAKAFGYWLLRDEDDEQMGL